MWMRFAKFVFDTSMLHHNCFASVCLYVDDSIFRRRLYPPVPYTEWIDMTRSMRSLHIELDKWFCAIDGILRDDELYRRHKITSVYLSHCCLVSWWNTSMYEYLHSWKLEYRRDIEPGDVIVPGIQLIYIREVHVFNSVIMQFVSRA